MSATLLALLVAASQNHSCPETLHHNACGSACNRTCLDLSPVCVEVCTPRCECLPETPIWFPDLGACGLAAACPATTPPIQEALIALPFSPPPPMPPPRLPPSPSTPPSPPPSPSLPPYPSLPPPPPQPLAAAMSTTLLIVSTLGGILAIIFMFLCCFCYLCKPAPSDATCNPQSGATRPLLTTGVTSLALAAKPPWTFKSLALQSR